MIQWKQLRIPFLAITFISTLLIFGKSVTGRNIGRHSPLTFPSTVPLPGWQFLGISSLVKKPEQQYESYFYSVGQHYRYAHNHLPLDIEMRYIVNTDGDISNFVQEYTSVPLSSKKIFQVLRQHPEAGFYSLFTYQNKAYLSSCINSRGGSTVTHNQFIHNQITYDLQFYRLVPWLLSQRTLRDRRCLWTNLSIPLNHSSPEYAYRTLENAWFNWQEWWRPRFPKP